MKYIICIFVLFFISISLPSYAQSGIILTEETQNTIKSILDLNEKNSQKITQIISNIQDLSSELNEELITIHTNQEIIDSIATALKGIKITIIENQQRTEDTQLTNTLVQVSGIFVAIMGGFFTTKMLSISTEKIVFNER